MSGDIRVIEDILIVLGSCMNNIQIFFYSVDFHKLL